ncbi:MAG: fibronectin-binding protein (FBP), partial [Candidatus Kryptonium sp.]
MKPIDFSKENILYLADEQIDITCYEYKDKEDINYLKIRRKVEPWLTAFFQSEHLSLLVGSGLSIALSNGNNMMSRIEFKNDAYKNLIKDKADTEAKDSGRGEANLEDDLSVAIKLLEGYKITKDKNEEVLEKEITENLEKLIENVITIEKKLDQEKLLLLKKFLLSFGSRP